jgi:DNA-binding NtrC family response regulator
MFSFARLSPILLSLLLVAPAGAAFAEDDEPPVLRGDEAVRAAEPVDPVQVEKMAEEVRQVPLTEDMVDRFIASFKEMRDVAKKFPETKLPDSVIDEAPGSEFKHMSPEKREAMTKVAVANGFKDLDEWSVVGASIAMSFTYALQGKKPGELAKAINMHIAEVKEDRKLTAEQKESQIAQLQDFGKKLGRLEPMQQNFELVEQMKAKVAPIMNFQ